MINGVFFDGKTSAKNNCAMRYDEQGYVQITDCAVAKIHIDLIKISSRLANTPRYLNFPDGSLFETNDNDAIDHMLAHFKPSFFTGLLHNLESARFAVLSSITIVILSGWLLIQYGIPYFSNEITEMLPAEASKYMGDGVLEVMDKNWFKESKLSAKKQAELRQVFKKLLMGINNSSHYKLEFRLGGVIRANAFALPNGTIVFTDELINLAANNMEVASIMLHEVGHLRHRHSLRATVQQFGLAMFIMTISGDVSTSSSVVSAIPLMLVKSGFSQEMESEADTFALDYMQKHKIDPRYFVTMMEKLEASYSPEYTKCIKATPDTENKTTCIKKSVELNKNHDHEKTLTDYFSTHPNLKERIKKFSLAN